MTATFALLGVILVIGTLVTGAALVLGAICAHVPLLVWALFAMIAIPLNLR